MSLATRGALSAQTWRCMSRAIDDGDLDTVLLVGWLSRAWRRLGGGCATDRFGLPGADGPLAVTTGGLG